MILSDLEDSYIHDIYILILDVLGSASHFNVFPFKTYQINIVFILSDQYCISKTITTLHTSHQL